MFSQKLMIGTVAPLYKTTDYKTVRIKDGLKVSPQKVVSKPKMSRLYRKWPFIVWIQQKCLDYIKQSPFVVIFSINLDIFVWL